MRTTIDLDAPLLRQLKTLAACQGRTLSEVVCELLRAGLGAQTGPEQPVMLPVVQGEGPAPSWTEIEATLSGNDLALYTSRTVGRVAEG